MENPINTFLIEIKDEFESSFNREYLFQSFVLSLSFYWSNFLVQKTNKLVHMNDNATQNKKHIDIDIIDKNLMQNLVGIDVLIISTEHWYNVLNPYIFLEGNQIIGRCNFDKVLGMTKHNNLLAYAYKNSSTMS